MPDTTPIVRSQRKERLGRVLSNKMAKTIVVEVERRYPHAKYKKVITAHAKFYAHDEKGEAQVGDLVLIRETRPLSKLKRWRLSRIVERSRESVAAAAAPPAAA
ncbi:MAG TPA: 30S ribosomal protein S17 [Candidatus Acidoferrum sp.]|nr:30S ribosomal protein S17 [Candidatus Acidoferrum sp.]